MGNRTTLSISIQTYNELNRVKNKLEKILRRDISFDQCLRVMLAARALDAVLQDMILEG